MNALEIAQSAEAVLNEMDFGYERKQAVLFAIVFSPNNALTLKEITSNGDVYELLNDKRSITALAKHDKVLVATCGWASPVGDDDDDNDLPPSVHPKRRRVRLSCCLSDEGVASVLRFSDTPDETITDEGKARGSLADALNKLRKKARRTKSKTQDAYEPKTNPTTDK